MSKSEKDDPIRETPNTDKDEATLAKPDRIDNELPTMHTSSREKEDPKRGTPSTDKVAATREKLRRESVLPSCKKSTTAKLAPTWLAPKTATEDAIRGIALSDSDDPT
jgi:hypothetical protein